MADSFLDNGFLLNKSPGQNQPRRVENARVLLANTAMDTDKIKVFGSRVRTNDIKSLAEIEQAEKDKMKEKVEKICEYDMNVFINRQLIYNCLFNAIFKAYPFLFNNYVNNMHGDLCINAFKEGDSCNMGRKAF